jgi:hypothetical protein
MEQNKRKREITDINEQYGENELDNLVIDMNSISINYNMEILLKIIKKIENLDKKIDDFSKIEIKMEKLNNKMESALIEKDYIIDNLKDEIYQLRNKINDLENSNSKKYQDYDYFN